MELGSIVADSDSNSTGLSSDHCRIGGRSARIDDMVGDDTVGAEDLGRLIDVAVGLALGPERALEVQEPIAHRSRSRSRHQPTIGSGLRDIRRLDMDGHHVGRIGHLERVGQHGRSQSADIGSDRGRRGRSTAVRQRGGNVNQLVAVLAHHEGGTGRRQRDQDNDREQGES